MRLGHLIGATSNATAARCRGSSASSLSKIASILSKTASVQVGADLFGQTKTLKGVELRPPSSLGCSRSPPELCLARPDYGRLRSSSNPAVDRLWGAYDAGLTPPLAEGAEDDGRG